MTSRLHSWPDCKAKHSRCVARELYLVAEPVDFLKLVNGMEVGDVAHSAVTVAYCLDVA